MEGYEVQTIDDEKVGKVVGVTDDYLIVEHGMLFKSRHAVPRQFAHVDEAESAVRLSVPRNIVEDSPKLGDGDSIDAEAVAQHYGLAEGYAAPETEGYGIVDPGDPALSSEVEAASASIETAPEERVRIRESIQPGRQASGVDSPGLLGNRAPEGERPNEP